MAKLEKLTSEKKVVNYNQKVDEKVAMTFWLHIYYKSIMEEMRVKSSVNSNGQILFESSVSNVPHRQNIMKERLKYHKRQIKNYNSVTFG